MARIVFVDDSKLMRNLVQHILEQAGHEVEVWDEVVAAEIPAMILAAKADLIITDYQMPGCNGLTVARMARKAAPDMPVVILTSTHDPAVMDALHRQDVTCILHKPLNEEGLLEVVAKVTCGAKSS